jgi:hypothetical protein
MGGTGACRDAFSLHMKERSMTRIIGFAAAALAVVTLATTADAGSRKRHTKFYYDPGYTDTHAYHPGYRSYGYAWRPGDARYDRHDPSTWSHRPMNAWDKARRDDALLGRW